MIPVEHSYKIHVRNSPSHSRIITIASYLSYLIHIHSAFGLEPFDPEALRYLMLPLNADSSSSPTVIGMSIFLSLLGMANQTTHDAAGIAGTMTGTQLPIVCFLWSYIDTPSIHYNHEGHHVCATAPFQIH